MKHYFSSFENGTQDRRFSMPIGTTIHAGDKTAHQRLDKFLAENSPLFASRKAAYKAVKRGRVTVNGLDCTPNQRIENGDKIEVCEETGPLPPPLELPLEVVFEDSFVAVLIKPPGIPASGNFARTIQRALPANLDRSCEPDALRLPHPVHRLDGPTGGLLLIAKTAAAMTTLSRQFEQRRVFKKYCAVTAGPLPDWCRANSPVEDREARTEFKVVRRVPSLNYTEMCLVECFPETGRKHQIRSHLAELNAPVVGDRTHNAGKKVMKGKGLFLWAVELAFEHPESGEIIHVLIEPPPKFKSLLDREKRRTAQLARD